MLGDKYHRGSVETEYLPPVAPVDSQSLFDKDGGYVCTVYGVPGRPWGEWERQVVNCIARGEKPERNNHGVSVSYVKPI